MAGGAARVAVVIPEVVGGGGEIRVGAETLVERACGAWRRPG